MCLLPADVAGIKNDDLFTTILLTAIETPSADAAGNEPNFSHSFKDPSPTIHDDGLDLLMMLSIRKKG